MNLAMVVLIAGLIIVFLMLILLTLIIQLYGTIIYKNQTNKKSKTKNPEKLATINQAKPVNSVNTDDLSGEIIAVISAAVAALGEKNSKRYEIKNITQSLNQFNFNRSEWSMAGKLANTKPF